MLSEPTTTLAASSWTALFASVWFSRNARAVAPRKPSAPRRPNAPPRRPTEDERVDLFVPVFPTRGGRRFDDTVAWPVDTPCRLAATIQSVTLRLRALPPPQDLGRRTLHYRTQLLTTLRAAHHALARIDEGTYGTCTDCAEPISLTTLTEKPWATVCAWCAADLTSVRRRVDEPEVSGR